MPYLFPFAFSDLYMDREWSVSFTRSLLEILSYHQISKMRRKQRQLIVTVSVTFLVSLPYRKTDITFVLKSRIFIRLEIFLFFHIAYNWTNRPLTLFIRLFTSSNKPPSLLTSFPREMNDPIYSITLSFKTRVFLQRSKFGENRNTNKSASYF